MATADLAITTRSLGEILDDLGGIDPARVLLKQPLGQATEADLIRCNAGGSTRCELVDGMLVEKGMGYNANPAWPSPSPPTCKPSSSRGTWAS